MPRPIEPIPQPPSRVLIVRLSALGDVVHCLPAIAALRAHWPNTKFDAVTEELGRIVLEGHPEIDRLLVLQRKAWLRDLRRGRGLVRHGRAAVAFARELRAHRYDAIVDFQGNSRSFGIGLVARAPVRFTHHRSEVKESGAIGARSPAEPAGRGHRIDKNLHLVRALGWSGELSDVVPKHERSLVEETEARRARPVLVQPFVSRHGLFKQWPVESFVRLIRSLRERAIEVVLSCGPGEEEDARALVAACPPGVTISPPTPTAAEFAALLESARVFVAADTGPLHLAAHLGTPVVGLYGPKDPAVYAPRGERARILRSGIACSPCTLRRCSHAACMQLLPAERVTRAVLELCGVPTQTVPSR